jgi:two-component system OmpR family response regulator
LSAKNCRVRPEAPRVLVVEDEPAIRDVVATALRYEGMEVVEAGDAYHAMQAAKAGKLDLAVVDVLIPGGDGFELARLVRVAHPDLAILFLTAKDDIEDKVRGFEVGGDDYLTKPFMLRELIARAKALLRRSKRQSPSQLVAGELALDPRSHRVLVAGKEVQLTPTEFRLLRFLMENEGTVVSKAEIAAAVWGWGFDGDYSVVETYVSYLRKKLGTAWGGCVRTVRGVGYMLVVDNGATEEG